MYKQSGGEHTVCTQGVTEMTVTCADEVMRSAAFACSSVSRKDNTKHCVRIPMKLSSCSIALLTRRHWVTLSFAETKV